MKLLFENWRQYLNETIGLDDNPNLADDPDAFKTAKKPIELRFRYADAGEEIRTKEGLVTVPAGGAAIMTGTEGEEWPIPLNPEDSIKSFSNTYDVKRPGIAAKKDIDVWAKKMDGPFQVKVSWSEALLKGGCDPDPDVGCDYLVQYGPGDYGVVGAEIFRKTYKWN
jgi:hypothetical protein